MAEVSVNSTPREARALPSDLKQVGVVAKYDVMKYLRSRRLLGMLIIEAIVLIAITVLLATSSNPKTADGVVGQYAGFATILIVIGATLFGGDAIVSEYQGRTGYLLFPNPIKKVSIIIGKFISAVAAMVLILVIYYAIALVAGLVMGNGFSTLGLASLGLAILYGISALAVAFLISSFMKGTAGSLILTFALFFFVLDIISSIMGQLGGIKPWFLLNFAGSSLSYVTTDPFPVDSVETLDIGGGQSFTFYSFYPDIGLSIAVMVAYAVVALVLAYLIFRRREMSA
ncbi:MAG: ABC transporter permease subunit [Methanomassiliicoccus sp.]|nr:ABC transporter permease subunit [Methanomassiliicoccus sp.]